MCPIRQILLTGNRAPNTKRVMGSNLNEGDVFPVTRERERVLI